jgi:peptidoglycan/xylan/chitin deacetylase (PgdA/CDA1 family)
MWILRSMHERISFNLYGHLENILDTLSNYGVSATFFISGTIAEKHPRIPQKICRHGHEIASHGYSHKNLSKVSYAEAKDEISKSIKILSKFQEIKGFRAPFLIRNKATYLACEKLGLSYDSSEHGLVKYCPSGFNVTILPVISPIDTHGLDFMHLRSKDLVIKWLHQCCKSNGATVCMHIWRIGRKKHIKAILEPLLKSNLTLLKASDLLYKDGIALTFEVEYTSLSDSLPVSLRFWDSNVKDYARIASDPKIIDNKEKEVKN